MLGPLLGQGVETEREHAKNLTGVAFWRGSKPNARGSKPNAGSISCGRHSTVALSLAKTWFDMIFLCIRDRRAIVERVETERGGARSISRGSRSTFDHVLWCFPEKRFDIPSKPFPHLCSLLIYMIYTPSSLRHRPRRNRCVFSCKMRLAFISTVNLHVTPADRGKIVVFSHVKCAWVSTVNLHVSLANPGEIVVFFNKNANCTNPPRFLVFSQVNCILRSL